MPYVESHATFPTPVDGISDDSGDLSGATLENKYLILSRLGEGGMGVVYEAIHVGLNRRCAIKVLNPSNDEEKYLSSRFKREALITGALGHPNIIEVTDTGATPSGQPYLVMELLQGQSLAKYLSEKKNSQLRKRSR